MGGFYINKAIKPDDLVWSVRLTDGTAPEEQSFCDHARHHGAEKTANGVVEGIKLLDTYFRHEDADAARDFFELVRQKFGNKVRMDRLW
jgi:hypothetical protein